MFDRLLIERHAAIEDDQADPATFLDQQLFGARYRIGAMEDKIARRGLAPLPAYCSSYIKDEYVPLVPHVPAGPLTSGAITGFAAQPVNSRMRLLRARQWGKTFGSPKRRIAFLRKASRKSACLLDAKRKNRREAVLSFVNYLAFRQ